ncbi:VCBS domain-containing protein, partial [uncultured Tenacibaculum sp.]|uniref:beta strand repeat-containing protein n=1 Tax=uncultured Tenacibaculum sp. TaxID=174713 RepID=UPI002636C62F
MIIYFRKLIPIVLCKLKGFKINIYNRTNKVFFYQSFLSFFKHFSLIAKNSITLVLFILLTFNNAFANNRGEYELSINKDSIQVDNNRSNHYYVYKPKISTTNTSNNANPFSMFALPTIDLNGNTAGVDNTTDITPTTSNVFPLTNSPVVTSDAGILSATISFSGIVDTPNEELLAINNGSGFDLYYFNTTYDAITYNVGGVNIRVTQLSDTTFSVTHQPNNGTAIPNATFESFLELLFYGDLATTFTEGVRTMSITITDTNSDTASAQTTINAFEGVVAVDETNSVMANNTGTITGNVLANEAAPSSGTLLISEVDVYSASVGTSYTTLFGSITINSDGSYTYDVDETNPAVTGLRSGESIDDIISYTVQRSVSSGIFDYAYLTVTINGVDELPNAVDNTKSMTAFVDPNATGNVITDPGPGGAVDAIDRGLSTLVWENEFVNGGVFVDVSASINGETRTIGTAPNDVTLIFTTEDPDNVGVADQNLVVFRTQTNGGHTGYFRYTIDPSTSPTADVTLTIDFNKPVFNLGFLVVDIDYSQGTAWQDQINIQGSLSSTSVPFNFITTGGVVNPSTGTFYGTGNAVPEDATGNVNVFFDQPIDQLVLSYNYGPDATDIDKGLQLAGISDIFWQGESSIQITQVDGSAGNLGVSYAGTYGSIIMNADGSYDYILDTSNPAVQNLLSGQTLTETFNYTLFDGFNTDNANLIITINGSGTDSDSDGISDLVDLDDDNDGILDTNECPENYIELRPSMLGLGAPITSQNSTVTDVSSNFGLPVGSLFVQVNSASTVSGDRFVTGVADNASYPEFTLSGPAVYRVAVRIEHGNTITTQGRVDGFEALDGIGYSYISSLDSNFSDQTTGTTYQIRRDNSPLTNSTRFSWQSNERGVTNFRVFSDDENLGTGNQRSSVYFVSFEIMEDTDFDGIGDCFDLDSDNDGCDDVVESGGNDDNDDGRLNGHPTVDGIGTATPGQVTNGSTEGGYNGANGSEIISDTFTVAITPDPGIACDGEDFVFTATATGTRVTDFGATGGTGDDTTIAIPAGDYTYRWYLGASTTPLTDVAPYSGTSTSMLTIAASSGLAGNVYRVEVTTTGNSCSQEDTVTLTTVNPSPVATVNDPSVCVGDTSATLTVTATTGTPTQYTIDYNAAAEAAGFSDVATSTSLTGAT